MNKTNIILVFLFVSLLPGLYSCDNSEPLPAKISPSASGTWTDTRDGEVYGWVQYGNLQWMTENFRYDTGDINHCHNYIEEADFQKYSENYSTRNRARWGMYYTHEAAVKACPEGWHLPTDAEWQQLEQICGMSASLSNAWNWRGNVAFSILSFEGNATDMQLGLGGFVTQHIGTYLNGSRYKGAWGFYWTDTADESKEGEYFIYRKFAYDEPSIYRQSMESSKQMLSVRYVRNAN